MVTIRLLFKRLLIPVPANQVVQLAAGTFRISGNGLNLTTFNITLRGAGAGTGASGGSKSEWTAGNPNGSSHFVGGGTGTFLLKADRETNTNYGIFYVGNDPTGFAKYINLTADNSFECLYLHRGERYGAIRLVSLYLLIMLPTVTQMCSGAWI